MLASALQDVVVPFAAKLSQVDEASASWLGGRLLGCPPRSLAPFDGRSTLNTDGAPLQLLASLGPARASYRLIGDPAFYLPDPLERLEQSLAVLPSILRAARAESIASLCKQVMASILPKGADALRRYPQGMLLLASGLGSDGAAVYVGTEPGCADAWSRVIAAARAALPDPRWMLDLVRSVAPSAVPLGVAVEGATPESARVKLYWVPSRVEDAAGVDPRFGLPPVSRFLGAMLRAREIPPGLAVLSAAFRARDGSPADVKLDVGLPHLRGDRGGQLRAIGEALAICDLGGEALANGLLAGAHRAMQAVFLGVGVAVEGAPRVNVYLAQQLDRPSPEAEMTT